MIIQKSIVVFPVIGFDTLEEANAIANSSRYGLSSGILTGDFKKR